jgi:hypothetical protein
VQLPNGCKEAGSRLRQGNLLRSVSILGELPANIRGLKAPATGQVDIWNGLLPGFGIRVGAEGAKPSSSARAVLIECLMSRRSQFYDGGRLSPRSAQSPDQRNHQGSHTIQPSSLALSLASFQASVRNCAKVIETRLSSFLG